MFYHITGEWDWERTESIKKKTRSPGTTSVYFSVVSVNDEHSVGVKFKEDSGLKATGICIILLSQDGFERDSPERES